MEKAKAIAHVKDMYAHMIFREDKEALETLIPELKESEDERMATRLIHLIHTGGYLEEPIRTQILAWLEKQQDHFRDDAKMVEQKPAEWSEDKDFEDCLTELACELYEQRDDSPENTAFKENEILKKWTPILLKKARRKVDWSEEDEENMELVIDCIYNFYPDPVIKYKLKDWLKSLRPSWKPSEEQMKEYSYWYRNFIESGLSSPTSKAVTVLGELLEHLKKLI